jgi:hypothetical protein
MNNDRTESELKSNYLAFARRLRTALEYDTRNHQLSEKGSRLIFKLITQMEEAVWSAESIHSNRGWTSPRYVLLDLLEIFDDVDVDNEKYTDEQFDEADTWIKMMTVGPADDRDCAVPIMNLNQSLDYLVQQIQDVENKVPQLHVISITVDVRNRRVTVHATDGGIDEDKVDRGGGIIRWLHDQGYIKFDKITTECNGGKPQFAQLSFLKYTTTGTIGPNDRISWFCYHEYSKEEEDQNEYPM